MKKEIIKNGVCFTDSVTKSNSIKYYKNINDHMLVKYISIINRILINEYISINNLMDKQLIFIYDIYILIINILQLIIIIW